MKTPYYLARLREEFDSRRQRNARFSQRAFAKTLGIDPALLSKIMTGKRTISKDLAKQIVRQLGLAEPERKLFLASIVSRKFNEKTKAWDAEILRPIESSEINSDLIEIIREPYYYAILELTYAADFKPDAKWIANRLGLTTLETENAVTRLLGVGLLKRDGSTLKKTRIQFTTNNQTATSDALKFRYNAVLSQARKALQMEPLARRNMTSMTMCIDPNLIPMAKAMIQEFTNSLCAALEAGERKEVFELAISLFSLEKTAK